MSGRPPPTGPRALRAPILPGAPPGQSPALSPTLPSAHPPTHGAHSPQLPAALPPGPPRFTAIPTGPRSLVNGPSRPPPKGPKHSTPPTPTLVPPSSRHAPSSAAEKRPAGASRAMDSGVIPFFTAIVT
ncbi:hypothetical protein AGABI2DRAFT_121197, partial [Agaricus bisporus var. bisporus H97]|uniref:hypothetical protein n=1 Tax=Agaricus bisporus var. bisporus (strain H97 / ATCC MYA-4626 / FGSC 10389) TaxID=936046 RepID=UPI00029F7BF3